MKKRDVRLLGPLQIAHTTEKAPSFRSQKTAAILAYLIANERPVARATLAVLFWPDADFKTGHANLRRELHILNRILPSAWELDRNAVRYAGSDDVRLDLHEVRRLEENAQWIEAAQWLRGDFVEGLALDDNLEFETWLSGERERWRQRAEHILLRAAEVAWELNDPDAAQEYLRQLLHLAPWNEQAHRRLIRILARLGRYGAALKQYANCQDALENELGVSPSPATEALARRIRIASSVTPFDLPPAPGALIGRDKEMTTFARRLLDPNCRLLCLTGLSGIGKSRLALQLAHLHAAGHGRRFLHGAAFVSLARVEPANIPATIAHGLQLHTFDHTPDKRQLLDFLREREMLLVIDHCQPTAVIHDLLQSILAQAPEVTLLVTATAKLTLQQAWTAELSGLETRSNGRRTEEVALSPAAKLFAKAASRTLASFSVMDHLDDVEELCSAVSGMPLALLLAASWVNVMSPAAIRREISKSLDILATESGDLPVRQRSLRSVLELSWQQLTPESRAVVTGLITFQGPFTGDAALSVLDTSPQVLKQLIACAFVQQSRRGLLEVHSLVSQFLAEKAAEESDRLADLWLDRHMTTYLAWSATEMRELRLTLSASRLGRLKAEWQQIEAAWWRAVSIGRTDLLDDCMDIVMVFEATGSWREGLQFFARTKRLLPAESELIHARLDEVMSLLHFRLFDMREAKRLAERAIAALDRESNRKPDWGLYTRVPLATYTYLTSGPRGYPAFVVAMRELTADHFGVLGTVAAPMIEGARDCRFGNCEKAVSRFQAVLQGLGADSYALPNIRCMLGISYLGLGDGRAAAEQFQMALARSLELGVLPAQVSATLELRQLNGGHRLQDANAALADLASQTGAAESIGHAAIHVGVNYLNFGRNHNARLLFHVGLQLLWSRVEKTEFASASFTVGKFLLMARLGQALRVDE
ncbi:MAG: hypothetical protein KC546_04440 [Anaerolineae bacterium]|nr:hypothetical protein [Anaerolineae bacterium]